ncbi:MAG: hypothetical protein IJG13_22340, partial [Kiritimatiellae bacterium]|nr:hypothetical protein [Kiritimatiellia bacterium]
MAVLYQNPAGAELPGARRTAMPNMQGDCSAADKVVFPAKLRHQREKTLLCRIQYFFMHTASTRE